MALRDVLNAFEQGEAQSLTQLSRTLDLEPAMLDSMIQFWVKKGKLREVCDSGCSGCSAHGSCPVVVSMSHRYELVTETNADSAAAAPRCACCH